MNDPRITDEVTFQALRGFEKRPGYSKFERMRDALEVAAPLLAPQPSLPACPNCEGEHFTCGACGIVLDATPQVVDREELEKTLRSVLAREGVDEFHDLQPLGWKLADAVIDLRNGTAK